MPQLQADAQGGIAIRRRGEILDVFGDGLHPAAVVPDDRGAYGQRHDQSDRAVDQLPAAPVSQAQQADQREDGQEHPAAARLRCPGRVDAQQCDQHLQAGLGARPARAGAPAYRQQRHHAQQQRHVGESHGVVASANVDHRGAAQRLHGDDQHERPRERARQNGPLDLLEPTLRRPEQHPEHGHGQCEAQQFFDFGTAPPASHG
ncbi:hypothetical protein D3C71_627690 [compost metagenome]